MGRLLRILYAVLTILLATLALASLAGWMAPRQAPLLVWYRTQTESIGGQAGPVYAALVKYRRCDIVWGYLVVAAGTGVRGFNGDLVWVDTRPHWHLPLHGSRWDDELQSGWLQDMVVWLAPPSPWQPEWHDYRSGYEVEPQHVLTIPLWWLAVLFGAWPAYWLQRWIRRTLRRRRRQRAGLCIKCGYDLRASPACCPECGTAA